MVYDSLTKVGASVVKTVEASVGRRKKCITLYRFKKALSAWVGTLALQRPHATQASRTAEGSRPYQPQLGHSFRNMVL